jgi:hypothetical protein
MKLQLCISNHNYQKTAGSKQYIGNTVMKYVIALTINCNKKNMPVRINNICMYVCVCMYVRMCVRMYVCIMYVCIMYVCMNLCVYVCIIYVCVCMYVCIVLIAIKLHKNKLNSLH